MNTIRAFFEHRFGANGYLDEHLFIGHFGHFLVLLSFFAIIFAAISYFFASSGFHRESKATKAWKKIARFCFITHTFSVIGIFVTLFIMIFNHWFEYYYVWRHSDLDLPLRYMISCFWEGQEGSFLLWQFWHGILGLVMIWRLKKWEAPVMTVVSTVQIFLATMILGVYVFGYKVGINPFVLLRDAMPDTPIFSRADYLSLIADGNGLNALLQNYWMVIHPPVLFLGFASTVVPFAFAIASLSVGEYKKWASRALPWTLFSGAALGTGILMGGAWAYESLSFGGFWAWDPVENASLVPWLILIAGLHTLVIYKSTGQSKIITYLFLILSFVFVLYSTYLTRSGILGDSSVHSFTDDGLSVPLIIFLGFFAIMPILLLIFRAVTTSSKTKEEPFWSREFWMFLGAILIILSAVQITFTTSIPVFNKIFDSGFFVDLKEMLPFLKKVFKTDIAAPVEREAHYNSIQIWVAVLIGLFTAVIQFFNYKSKKAGALKWLLGSLVLSVIFTLIMGFSMEISALQTYAIKGLTFTMVSGYILLLFASLFAIFANVTYLVTKLKLNALSWGGSIAHLGFGLMLLGILISQGKQYIISQNVEGIPFSGFEEKDAAENRLLMQNTTIKLDNYLVTYEDKENINDFIYYNIRYKELNENNDTINDFYLRPYVQENGEGELVPNPDTKHYLTRDIFTHITSFSTDIEQEDVSFTTDTISIGDTLFTDNHYITLDTLVPNPPHDSIDYNNGVLAVGAALTVRDLKGNSYSTMPVYMIDMLNNNSIYLYPDKLEEIGLTTRLDLILPLEEKMVLSHKEEAVPQDFVIMRAIVFPYINVLWIGIIIMVLGFLLSAFNRSRQNKRARG